MASDQVTLRQLVRRSVEEQSSGTVTVLSSLLAVQDSVGYIPVEALEEIALAMDTSMNEVWGVASFYPNFRFSPGPVHSLEICWGPTCHLLGAQSLLKMAMTRLGLLGEGDTEDGGISLRLNPCLGACPHGPVMNIDHQTVGHLTQKKLFHHLDLLSGSEKSQPADKDSFLGQGDSS